MPTPLHENEEFEFRARAEQEASAPPQVKTEGAAPQQSWGQQAWETAKGVGNEAVRAGSQAITGLPTMVADVPVAVGNLIKGKDKSGNYPPPARSVVWTPRSRRPPRPRERHRRR